ncbi:MAG: DoxX family protein [Bacteroidota bacterium]
MATIKSLNKWANAHTYYPIDFVRIALGIFLLYKGVDFMSNPEQLAALSKPLGGVPGSMLFLNYLIPAHFVGGVLIVFGLLTRWAVLAQLPILVGAVLTNFLGEMNLTNFTLSGITLLVCVFFLFYGSGKHSADYYLKMQK